MKFRFEPILNLKGYREDDCKFRMKREETTLLKINERLESLEARSVKEAQYLESVGTGHIDLYILSTGSGILSYLHQKRVEANEERISQEEQVKKARTALVSARKERKTMEKLKENFLNREKKATLTQEQKVMDEIGINRVHLGKR